MDVSITVNGCIHISAALTVLPKTSPWECLVPVISVFGIGDTRIHAVER